MEWILAVAAFAASVYACVSAARSTAAVRRLALEMVQLRDRLARAEHAAQDRGREAGTNTGDQATEGVVLLQARVTDLEGRLREALVRPVAQGAEPLGSVDLGDDRARILRHLTEEGYEHVAFLGPADEGAWLVEAERGGLVTKGRAEIAEDGTVLLHSVSSARAFP